MFMAAKAYTNRSLLRSLSKMEKKSWACTLITQLSLCIALFVALNIGSPQNFIHQHSNVRTPLDLHFITVTGGFRPLSEQTLLLKQVEKAVKTYNAEFVVDIGMLGEEDPLMQNATRYFQLFGVPWYTTGTLEREGASYFLKKVIIPHEKTLELIGLETGSLQDPSSGSGRDQLLWLTKILNESDSNWRIIVGFHPMLSCDSMEGTETTQVSDRHSILLKYGVNAYLSGQSCGDIIHQGDDKSQNNSAGPLVRGPYISTRNQRVVYNEKSVDGFLLHRVSSLEIVTYFISLTGEVVHTVAIQQHGREAV